MPTPTVSVVTIFLDAERFLEEAIASVRAQTYADWELLLVDDGSTDGSGAIARRHAAAEPGRIRYLRHPDGRNHGMSASRNLGVAHARGRYLAFLDADDAYLPRKLERQVALLEARPAAAMVYGPTIHWYGWTGRPEDQGRDQPRRLGVPPDTLVPPPGLVPRFLRGEAQTPGTCGILVRRDAVERVGGFEEAFRGMFEDQVFVCKVCLEFPVFVSGESHDRYRQHPASHARRALAAGATRAPGMPSPAYERFLTWLEGYVTARDLRDPALRSALGRELAPYRSRWRGWLARAKARVRWWRMVAERRLAERREAWR